VKAGDQKKSTDDAGAINGKGWRTWLAVVSLGRYKSILSQDVADSKQMALETR
jgi:hypothetical protein